jgi:hypothetical protein
MLFEQHRKPAGTMNAARLHSGHTADGVEWAFDAPPRA